MNYYRAALSGDLGVLEGLPRPSVEELCWRNERGETPVFAWVKSMRDGSSVVAGCIKLAQLGWSLQDANDEGRQIKHWLDMDDETVRQFASSFKWCDASDARTVVRERATDSKDGSKSINIGANGSESKAITESVGKAPSPSRQPQHELASSGQGGEAAQVPMLYRSASFRKRSRSRGRVDSEMKTLSDAQNLEVEPTLLYDANAFSVFKAKSTKIKAPLVVKQSKWDDPEMAKSIEREARMATLIAHDRIARFHGIVTLDSDRKALVYTQYSMTLKHAIDTCKKPTKDLRISMIGDLLRALAWVHALSYAHQAIHLEHCFCEASYPYVVRVPFIKGCLLANLSHAVPATDEAMAQDIRDFAWIAACIIYWDNLKKRDADEWIETYATRHERARRAMKLLHRAHSFASAVDLLREWDSVLE